MRTIITTVGTSLFTNYKDFIRSEGRTDLISSYMENLESGDKNAQAYYEFLETDIAEIRYELSSSANENWLQSSSASAEIQSIEKFIQESNLQEQQIPEQIRVYLLATDTVLSRLAAEIIGEELNRRYPTIAVFEPEYGKDIIEGLTVAQPEGSNDPNFFDKGLMNLVERAKQLIDQAKAEEGEAVLNISGGYKGIIPVMTIIGQLEGVPLIYQYEKSDSLVKIGGLPVNFDMSLVYRFYPFYTNYETLEVTKNNKQVLESLDQKYGLFRPLEIDPQTKNVKTYQRTILGSLLNSYAYFKAPESLQVLGVLVEYKLYEYYNKSAHYNSVEREGKVLGKSRGFDIMLNQGEILLEAKSAEQVYSAFDENKDKSLYTQVVGQLQELKNLNAFPKEFIIYFYFVGKSYPEDSFSIIKQNLKKLKEYVSEFTENQTVLTAFYSEFGLDLFKESANNPYKSLLQKDLKLTPLSLD